MSTSRFLPIICILILPQTSKLSLTHGIQVMRCVDYGSPIFLGLEAHWRSQCCGGSSSQSNILKKSTQPISCPLASQKSCLAKATSCHTHCLKILGTIKGVSRWHGGDYWNRPRHLLLRNYMSHVAVHGSLLVRPNSLRWNKAKCTRVVFSAPSAFTMGLELVRFVCLASCWKPQCRRFPDIPLT